MVLSTTGSGTAFFDGFGGTLTNVDNTIEGAGTVGSNHDLTLINEGTIDANIASGTLNVSTAALSNTGLMEATGTGAFSAFRTTSITLVARSWQEMQAQRSNSWARRRSRAATSTASAHLVATSRSPMARSLRACWLRTLPGR